MQATVKASPANKNAGFIPAWGHQIPQENAGIHQLAWGTHLYLRDRVVAQLRMMDTALSPNMSDRSCKRRRDVTDRPQPGYFIVNFEIFSQFCDPTRFQGKAQYLLQGLERF